MKHNDYLKQKKIHHDLVRKMGWIWANGQKQTRSFVGGVYSRQKISMNSAKCLHDQPDLTGTQPHHNRVEPEPPSNQQGPEEKKYRRLLVT